MRFRFAHNNINVLDLPRSLAFYREALGLVEVRRKEAEDGRFVIVFLGDGQSPHQLELTWLRDRTEPYDLGDNEFHLALVVDDYACRPREARGDGLHLLREPRDGDLLHPRPGRLLDRDPAGAGAVERRSTRRSLPKRGLRCDR